MLLDEVGPAYVAYGAFVTEGREELEHFGGDALVGALTKGLWSQGREYGLCCTYASSGSERLVDVEEADCALVGAVL